MKTLVMILSHVSLANLVMRHRVSKHSLITIFADTSEGGGLAVVLREDGSAMLRENGSYIMREVQP